MTIADPMNNKKGSDAKIILASEPFLLCVHFYAFPCDLRDRGRSGGDVFSGLIVISRKSLTLHSLIAEAPAPAF